MSAENYIKIRRQKILGEKTVVFELSYSKHVRKYFRSDKLYVEYEKSIESLDSSILQIPAISGIITVAWATGADVYVEELDKTYLESLDKIRSVMRHLHPGFSFSAKIDVGNIVTNRFLNNGYGLLFTVGVDSVTSYIKHKRKNPVLIHVWGTDVSPDVRPDDEGTFEKVRRLLTDFVDKDGAKLHVIRTNIPGVVNNRALYNAFGLQWWLQISHSIILSGLCAPLACVTNIGTLLIASNGRRGYLRATGSHPLVDNHISWADIKVVHDNYEMSRQEKIKFLLKDHMRNRGYFFLKACNNTQHPEFNCGKCEKCLRTIAELALEGIDPNKCGFTKVNSETFDHIKRSFIEKRLLNRRWIVESEGDLWVIMGEAFFWQDIQNHIPETLKDVSCGSKEFFEWFKDFDILEYLQQTHKSINLSLPYVPYMCALTLCDYMPAGVQKALKPLLDFWIDFFVARKYML